MKKFISLFSFLIYFSIQRVFFYHERICLFLLFILHSSYEYLHLHLHLFIVYFRKKRKQQKTKEEQERRAARRSKKEKDAYSDTDEAGAKHALLINSDADD